MRKEVVKNIPPRAALPASKKTLTEVFCDVDGKSIGYVGGTGRSYRCELCKRDICNTHAVRDYYHGGDYADIYCPNCFELYEPARKALDEKQDKEFEAMRKEVILKSLSTEQFIV